MKENLRHITRENTVTREELHLILGEELRSLAIETREYLGYTQQKMGEKLYMSESSYSDIETGRCYCGMTTTILLLEMQEDPGIFLRKAERKIAMWYEQEALKV